MIIEYVQIAGAVTQTLTQVLQGVDGLGLGRPGCFLPVAQHNAGKPRVITLPPACPEAGSRAVSQSGDGLVDQLHGAPAGG